MRLTVHNFMTLDGVVQGPGSPDEDRSGGFERGGWVVPYADEAFGTVVDGWFRKPAAFLYGRLTFEMMAGFWPQVTDPANIVARQLNTLPKYVASRTLTDPEWQNTTVLQGDALQAIRELKAQPGDGELQVHGCASLARQVHEAGLVDEFRLIVFPVVVGGGKRLFPDGVPASGFTVTESRTTPAGCTYLALTPKPFQDGAFTVQDGKDVVAS